MTLDSFVEELLTSGLLTPVQRDNLNTFLQQDQPTIDGLRAFLTEEGTLTGYQVEEMLNDRTSRLILGEYVILDRLGNGGMGEVFKVCHAVHRTYHALKLIQPMLRVDEVIKERFRREMHALSELAHQNVVLLNGPQATNDRQYIVTEYIHGVDLAHLVRSHGPLSIDLACDYTRQAALALQAVNRSRIVHRDVKPSNLMLRHRDGIIKLLDMGIVLLQAASVATLTGGSQLLGTPAYMAPEQARNPHEVDIRADLYSLGCTLYFLLEGRPPFCDPHFWDIIHHHTHSPPPALQRTDVPPAVQSVLSKLLQKNPNDRFQTPEQVAAALPTRREQSAALQNQNADTFYDRLIAAFGQCQNCWDGIHHGSISLLTIDGDDYHRRDYLTALNKKAEEIRTRRVVILNAKQQRELMDRQLYENFWQSTGHKTPSYWIDEEQLFDFLGKKVRLDDCALLDGSKFLHFDRNGGWAVQMYNPGYPLMEDVCAVFAELDAWCRDPCRRALCFKPMVVPVTFESQRVAPP